MLYSCTHVATLGVKGLIQLYWSVIAWLLIHWFCSRPTGSTLLHYWLTATQAIVPTLYRLHTIVSLPSSNGPDSSTELKHKQVQQSLTTPRTNVVSVQTAYSFYCNNSYIANSICQSAVLPRTNLEVRRPITYLYPLRSYGCLNLQLRDVKWPWTIFRLKCRGIRHFQSL